MAGIGLPHFCTRAHRADPPVPTLESSAGTGHAKDIRASRGGFLHATIFLAEYSFTTACTNGRSAYRLSKARRELGDAKGSRIGDDKIFLDH
jgi:hypothetical protein